MGVKAYCDGDCNMKASGDKSNCDVCKDIQDTMNEGTLCPHCGLYMEDGSCQSCDDKEEEDNIDILEL